MKVAITCDFLLERNHYTEIVELMCEIFPEARIYCFAHKPGMILGQIEKRKITSSFLSQKISTEEEFYKQSYKLPSIAKNIFVSCEYDLIINISKGFSQGFKKCESTKMITYLYDLGFENKIGDTFVQKIFKSYVINWAIKSLKNADKLLVSRDDFRHQLEKYIGQSEVMPPPFRVSDYSLFPKGMFKHHFFAIESNHLSLDHAKEIAEWMKEWNFEFQFIGHDDHLAPLKANLPANKFFGSRCSGEHAPVIAASKALISFNNTEFPQLVLATMATGRPVIIANDMKKWAHGTGTFFASWNKGSIKAMIDEVIANEELLDPQKIRAHVMDYHDIKFKAQMKRILEKYIGPHDHNHDHNNSQCCQ